jgi:hypothetical protein
MHRTVAATLKLNIMVVVACANIRYAFLQITLGFRKYFANILHTYCHNKGSSGVETSHFYLGFLLLSHRLGVYKKGEGRRQEGVGAMWVGGGVGDDFYKKLKRLTEILYFSQHAGL